MSNEKTTCYRLLSLLMIFAIGQTFAGTTNSQNTSSSPNMTVTSNDISEFNADNSSSGVKNTKPFNLSIAQDSLLGLIVDTNTLVQFNPNNAAAVELAGGSRVFRANTTYGYALNDKNRIKITGEYLTEDLDFNFYSGDTRQWVNQGAIGAAYQYWLGGNIFKSLQIGSHYSHAPSKQLSDEVITLDNGTSLLDQRRIAGGNDLNGTAETDLSLWRHSLLTVGADYDQIHYDTEYNIHENPNPQGVGGHIQLQQLLTPTTQLDLQSSVSSLFRNYSVGLNWLWASSKKTAWTAGLNSSYTNDYTTNRHFWVNGINVNIVWGAPQEKTQVVRYSDPDVSAQDLATWTDKPAVRMPDVLAISDEKLTTLNSDPDNNARRFVSETAVCPADNDIQYDSNAGTYSSGGWVESYPKTPIYSNVEPIFESANIMKSNSGMVECEYKVGIQKTILLTNSAYTNVEGSGNNWHPGQDAYWPTSEGTPAETCGSGSNTTCVFATVDPATASSTPAAQTASNSATLKNNASKLPMNTLRTLNNKV